MKGLWDKLFEHLPLDAAADQMGIKFQHEALPPVLSSSESTKVVSLYSSLYILFSFLLSLPFSFSLLLFSSSPLLFSSSVLFFRVHASTVVC